MMTADALPTARRAGAADLPARAGEDRLPDGADSGFADVFADLGSGRGPSASAIPGAPEVEDESAAAGEATPSPSRPSAADDPEGLEHLLSRWAGVADGALEDMGGRDAASPSGRAAEPSVPVAEVEERAAAVQGQHVAADADLLEKAEGRVRFASSRDLEAPDAPEDLSRDEDKARPAQPEAVAAPSTMTSGDALTAARLSLAAAPVVMAESAATPETDTLSQSARRGAAGGVPEATGADNPLGSAQLIDPDTDGPARPLSVAVLHRETHFAPVRSFTSALASQDEPGQGATDAPVPAVKEQSAPEASRAAAPLGRGQGSDPALERKVERSSQGPSQGTLDAATTPVGPATGSAAGAASAAPAMPYASLAAVGDAIATEVARLDGARPAGTATGAPPGGDVRGPVRVLEMMLSPESLGRVVVRMRLTPEGLDVRVRATDPQTARLLDQDRGTLAHLLKSHGIEVHDLKVDGVPNPMTSADGAARAAAAPPQPQDGEPGRQPPPDSQQERGAPQRRPQEDMPDDEAPSAWTDPGALVG